MLPVEHHTQLPAPLAEIADMTAIAGGAVVVFDENDVILFANEEQRRIMPCCKYRSTDTYSSLFWTALEHGFTGNPNAKRDPKEWLARAIGARINCPNMDFVNKYAWGSMLVSHVRLDNGMSIQARLDMRKVGLESYFSGPSSSMGVTRALLLRREINNLEAALDSLGLAVAIVSRDRTILHANTSFEDMLLEGDGIFRTEIGLSIAISDECDDFIFNQAIENVTSGALATSYAPIRRKADAPLILAISAAATPNVAIITATRFGEDAKAINAALREALGFTAAEAEVAIGIGTGKSVSEIAGDRKTTEGSTYQHLHKIRNKLRNSSFVAPDMAGIASLVTGIAAITRAPSRKH